MHIQIEKRPYLRFIQYALKSHHYYSLHCTVVMSTSEVYMWWIRIIIHWLEWLKSLHIYIAVLLYFVDNVLVIKCLLFTPIIESSEQKKTILISPNLNKQTLLSEIRFHLHFYSVIYNWQIIHMIYLTQDTKKLYKLTLNGADYNSTIGKNIFLFVLYVNIKVDF